MFHYADGSYSGIFPSDPMFFSDPNLQQQGYDVLNNMCDFYSGLETDLQDVVTGMTLMNLHTACHRMEKLWYVSGNLHV